MTAKGGLARPSASMVTLKAAVAHCPEQGALGRCPADMESTIDLFLDAGIWTQQGLPSTATVYTSRKTENPLFVSKGLVVDLFT